MIFISKPQLFLQILHSIFILASIKCYCTILFLPVPLILTSESRCDHPSWYSFGSASITPKIPNGSLYFFNTVHRLIRLLPTGSGQAHWALPQISTAGCTPSRTLPGLKSTTERFLKLQLNRTWPLIRLTIYSAMCDILMQAWMSLETPAHRYFTQSFRSAYT